MYLNTFQLLVAPLIAVLFGASLLNVISGKHRVAAGLAALVWLAALLAVLRPELTIRIARFMGIGRGADLVLYVFVIAFPGAAFYFYNRMMQLEAALTTMARYVALRDAAELEEASTESEKPLSPASSRQQPVPPDFMVSASSRGTEREK